MNAPLYLDPDRQEAADLLEDLQKQVDADDIEWMVVVVSTKGTKDKEAEWWTAAAGKVSATSWMVTSSLCQDRGIRVTREES